MARGLAARTSNDILIHNKTQQEYAINKLVLFPHDSSDETKPPNYDEPKIQCGSKEQLLNQIEQWESRNHHRIRFLNTPKNNTKAAAALCLTDSCGSNIIYGRYFRTLNSTPLYCHWPSKDLKINCGLTLKAAASQSEAMTIKPSDIFDHDEYLDAEDIIESIWQSKNVPNEIRSGIVDMLRNIKNNSDSYVDGMSKYRSTVEKYVGEFGAAIALLSQNKFNMMNQQDFVFNTGINIEDCNYVMFPTSCTEPLIDSAASIDGVNKTVGISSKTYTNGGASASIAIAHKLIQKQTNPDFFREHQELISIIDMIDSYNMVDGPLNVCVYLGLINEHNVETVKDLIDHNPQSLNDKTLKRILSYYPQAQIEHPNYNVGYHCLAACSRAVTEYINTSLDFSSLFCRIVENENLLQVYTRISKCGDALQFSGFDAVYPSLKYSITLDSTKNYMATHKPKGKFTFKMNKNV